MSYGLCAAALVAGIYVFGVDRQRPSTAEQAARLGMLVRVWHPDDVTRVTLLEGRDLIGTSPELTRNHMEVRGIGIINVPAMFGIRSIRTEKRVDLVVTLKTWNEVGNVDRVGIEEEKTKILGLEIPHITIPVRPGRDIARLIEVAAFHTKLRMLGYNPAKELNDRLIGKMAGTAGL